MSRTEMILAPNSVTNADAIYYKDATELASLIRTKQLSSREVVQAHLDRISAVNPKVNAIVTLLADSALKAADAAEKAVMSGAELGSAEPFDKPIADKGSASDGWSSPVSDLWTER